MRADWFIIQIYFMLSKVLAKTILCKESAGEKRLCSHPKVPYYPITLKIPVHISLPIHLHFVHVHLPVTEGSQKWEA